MAVALSFNGEVKVEGSLEGIPVNNILFTRSQLSILLVSSLKCALQRLRKSDTSATALKEKKPTNIKIKVFIP
jgi:hypothetical protein